MPLILRGRALRVGEARAGLLDESERIREMVWSICPVCGWKGWRDESDPATCEGEG